MRTKTLFSLILPAFLLLSTGCHWGKSVTPSSDTASDLPPLLSGSGSTDSKRPPEPVILENLLPVETYSSQREEEISHVVIHFMSALVTNPSDPYDMESCRKTLLDGGVSTHYIIDRQGQIYRLIPEERAAWHAGKGTWGQDERYTNRMNQYAIGIELLGMGTQEEMRIYVTEEEYASLNPDWIGFTDEQYAALGLLLDDILYRYPAIQRDRAHILGHDAYNPQKNDPGVLFEWKRIGII